MSSAVEKYVVDEVWLSDASGHFSADYWNDEAAEIPKGFYVRDANDRRSVDYVASLGCDRDLADALGWVRAHGGRLGRVADLAAGTCWLSALLSRDADVGHIDAVEFSRHRIGLLAPPTIAAFGGKPEKIRRIIGSFYELKVPPESYDAVFMAAAFHHADRVVDLIAEVKRVLRPGGCLVLIHEQPIRPAQFLKRLVVRSLAIRRPAVTFHDLFPADRVTGDHYYMRHHYRLLLEGAGLTCHPVTTTTRKFVLVARKPDPSMA